MQFGIYEFRESRRREGRTFVIAILWNNLKNAFVISVCYVTESAIAYFVYILLYVLSRQGEESFSCEYYQVSSDFSFTIHVVQMELIISEVTLMKYITSVQVLHAVVSQKQNISSPCFLIPFVTSNTFVCVEKRDLELLLLWNWDRDERRKKQLQNNWRK